MTIIEAINKLDSLKPNTYSQEQKVSWLNRLDQMILTNIVQLHEGYENVSFTGYHSETDLQTELLAKAPFDEMYLRWMEAQIDYHNGEIKRYNISMPMFNTEYEAFENWYRRNHMPLSSGRFLF